MRDQSMLTHLTGQAAASGADVATLRAMIEEASEQGAARALGALGLTDAHARRDMDELRQLLGAWREAKSSALKTFVNWLVGVALGALVLGMAVKLGLTDLVK